MTRRERVLVVLMVCLSLVLVPLTALAATGQLVNIVDGTNAARIARVEANGYLRVTPLRTSADVFRSAFAKSPTTNGYNWMSIGHWTGSPGVTGEKVVISEVDASTSTAEPIKLTLMAYRMPSTSSPCTNPKTVSGATPSVVAVWTITGPETRQFHYDTVPLQFGLVAGQKVCIGVESTTTAGRAVYGVVGGFTLYP